MSGAVAQNRFAPPRADVEDQEDEEAGLVDASRGARFLAALIDGLLPLAVGIFVVVVVALPEYERYRQARVPGIAPPHESARHLPLIWAWLGGYALIAFFIYSAVLVYLYGQTFGKRVMGIRVVRGDGSRVSFGRFVLLRWLPLAIANVVPVIGFVCSLLDPLLIFRRSCKCLHDDIADTQVVTAESSADATLRGDARANAVRLRTISF